MSRILRFSSEVRALNAFASMKSPPSTHISFDQRELAEGLPRLVSAPSTTSSWSRVAVWIHSMAPESVTASGPGIAAHSRCYDCELWTNSLAAAVHNVGADFKSYRYPAFQLLNKLLFQTFHHGPD